MYLGEPMTKKWNNIKEIKSTDKNVSKFVFTKNDAVAEAVLYKYPTFIDRTVICFSVQSGCPVGCRFCGTGDYFVRSLTSDEIIEQINHCLVSTGVPIDQIKKLQLMGMSQGEPMLNWPNVKTALIQLYQLYPQARLLISTSAPRNFGAFEELNEVSKMIPTIGLQFSVHESTDEARKKLIPSPTMKLAEISKAGVAWAKATGRRPFFNYCVHEGNNTGEDVLRLALHFDPSIWEATISVICERDEHIAAANERQRELASKFMAKMLNVGYSVRMFDPAGQDTIGGGCGQLWFVQDWMRNHPEYSKQSKGFGLPVVHTPRLIPTSQ